MTHQSGQPLTAPTGTPNYTRVAVSGEDRTAKITRESEDHSSSEKVADDSADHARTDAIGVGAGPDSAAFTRGREASPIPGVLKILRQAAKRDVTYVRIPVSPEKRERKANRSAKRKLVAAAWRTRRVMAPAYLLAGEAVYFSGWGVMPFDLYGSLTGALALAWWRFWWRRRGVRVDVGQVRGIVPRFRARRASRKFVRRWPQTCVDLNTVGMVPRKLTHDRWAVAVDLRTTVKHGIPEVRSLLPALERALDARRDSARVLAVPGDDRARSIRVRVMTEDPHASPITPPPFRPVEWSRPLIPVGTFETGEDVMIDLRQNLLIAGWSGSGKSMLVQVIMRALTRIPWVSVVGMDLGCGATELGPWEGRVEVIGKSVEDAEIILPALIAELERRGDLMTERGWKTWRCSPAEPFIATIIDECQGLVEAGYEGDLVKLAKLLRKYGGFLVCATQYPTTKAIPSGVKQQLQQTIGLRVKNETAVKVMFGDGAVKEGWTSHQLPKHRFLIQSDDYREPCRAMGYYLSEAEADRAVSEAPSAVRVRRGGDGDLRVALDRPAPEIGPARVAALPINRKEINRGRVLAALGPEEIHRREIEAETGLDQKTCDSHLAWLCEAGRAEKTGPALYRLTSA